MPKTPQELREQIAKQNAENPPADSKDKTAEGLEVERPSRSEFFSNLEKVSRPEQVERPEDRST